MTTRDRFPNVPRLIQFNPEPEIHSKDIPAVLKVLLRRLQQVIDTIWRNFQDLHIYASGEANAYLLDVSRQLITIESTDLNTSTSSPPAWHSATNDLLTLASETDIEFDFTKFWKWDRIVRGPGDGVYYYKLIPALDQKYPGIPDDGMAVYGYSATQLQLVQWNSSLSRWEAQSWKAGWTVYAWQAEPSGGIS